MRLIHTRRLELKEFFDSELPKYAILSHCWAKKEVTYQDFLSGTNRDGDGWKKIVKCCEIARRNQLDWAWVGTCCIDKSSTAELSEAINSMYRWYKQAEVCYAFISDYCSALEHPPKHDPAINGHEPEATHDARAAGELIDDKALMALESLSSIEDDSRKSPGRKQSRDPEESSKTQNIHQDLEHGEQLDQSELIEAKDESNVPSAGGIAESCDDLVITILEETSHIRDIPQAITKDFAESRWFTRGWTLQELLAPRVLYFYDHTGVQFGSKELLANPLAKITGIEIRYLTGKNNLSTASLSCRMKLLVLRTLSTRLLNVLLRDQHPK